MKYMVGHSSSTQAGKCIVCNKESGNYLTVSRYTLKDVIVGAELRLPVCNDCFGIVAKHGDVLVQHCVTINTMILKCKEVAE